VSFHVNVALEALGALDAAAQSRYSRMSERVQHDERCSSLHDRWCFCYDEQRLSLHAEGL